jgi:hypothetical protein
VPLVRVVEVIDEVEDGGTHESNRGVAELVDESVVNGSDDLVAEDSVGGTELAVDAKMLCVLMVGFGDLRGSGAVTVDQIWWWQARRKAPY